MTTTVTVKARAWGAKVEVNGETVDVRANESHSVHVQEGESVTLTVSHGDEPSDTDAVPGSAQNDALIQPVSGQRIAEASGTSNTTEPQGNMTGATEVAATTDPAAVEVPAGNVKPTRR